MSLTHGALVSSLDGSLKRSRACNSNDMLSREHCSVFHTKCQTRALESFNVEMHMWSYMELGTSRALPCAMATSGGVAASGLEQVSEMLSVS